MSFTLCPACRLPTERLFSALPCEECIAGLLLPPPICPTCFGFACGTSPEDCLRAWIRVDGGEALPYRLRSVTAAYVSAGPGFRVLKAWKTSRNPALERVLLAGVRRAISFWKDREDVILIPVPQSASRRWELFGGSTLRLCEMIRTARKESGLRTTVLEALEARSDESVRPGEPASPQAKTRGAARYGKASIFFRRDLELTNLDRWAGHSESPFIVVDDFLTSGSTVRRALQALRAQSPTSVSPFQNRDFDAFILGFRPSFFAETETKET
jgi:predicted amidophosphoribosyltransferase